MPSEINVGSNKLLDTMSPKPVIHKKMLKIKHGQLHNYDTGNILTEYKTKYT